MTRLRIEVGPADFDAAQELSALASGDCGGIGSFVGIVRAGSSHPRVTALTLEHYPGMTEAALHRIAQQATARWELTGCTIIHRTGRLLAGETIVFVGAASPHRAAALAATAFLIDWLKTAAPFWKHEEFDDGTASWVAANPADDAAAARWQSA